MATKIQAIRNDSQFPIAYVGTDLSHTGWAAWGFGPKATGGFGWEVERNEGNQALFTQRGTFFIWDAGNWDIMIKPANGGATLLVHVNGSFPEILITVSVSGEPSAKQI